MDLEKDSRIERLDPNAPKSLNLAKCQQLIRAAPQHARFPLGDVLQVMADQLKCAVDELGTISTKITDANNQMLRYQKESETANAEVRTMQTLLGRERDEVARLNAELVKLKPPPDATPVGATSDNPSATPKTKRGRKAKVVPIDASKAVAQ